MHPCQRLVHEVLKDKQAIFQFLVKTDYNPSNHWTAKSLIKITMFNLGLNTAEKPGWTYIFSKEGTTDTISIARQLQKKYFGKKRDLYFVFVNLEKIFLL